MRITAICPRCLSRYQVEENLRGRNMRCPNTLCRTVFRVEGEAESSPEAVQEERPFSQGSGTVAELVPLLPAEPVVESPEPVKEEKSPDWAKEAPPVRGKGKARQPPPSSPGEPREMPAGTWEAPPVRGQVIVSEPPPSFAETKEVVPTRSRQARRRSIRFMVFLLVVLAGGAVSAFYFLRETQAENESLRFKQAEELYQGRGFAEAAEAFQKLHHDFPQSKDRALYHFLAEFSAVREAVHGPRAGGEDVVQAVQRLGQFLEIYRADAFLKERQGDLWESLQRLTRDLLGEAEHNHDPGLLALAKRTWAETKKWQPPGGINFPEVRGQVEAELARLDQAFAARAQRAQMIAELKQFLEHPGARFVQQGKILARKANLQEDPEVQAILEELLQRHRQQVVFVPADKASPEPSETADSFPSLALVSGASQEKGTAAEEVMFALARGVLYALEPQKGEVRWARRVGADTQLLPLRVPAAKDRPEMALILASDSKTVTGVEAVSGKVFWQQTLEDACLGQPVLVDQVVLVPTMSGQVVEINVGNGQRQGAYLLGQPLLLGGVRQPGTSLVYFPADSLAVYGLDIAQKTCAGILYTHHEPGSLRSLPSILPRDEEPSGAKKAWLLWSQAQDNTALRLNLFGLPFSQPEQKPTEPEVVLRGWSWFPPCHDGEKLAVATDAGYLGLYGLRHKGNRDPEIFPLLKGDYLLEGDGKTRQGRPQVVHADADNLWVWARGKVRRLERTFDLGKGPGLLERWPEPPTLGSPLHAAQVSRDSAGATRLLLVSQVQDEPTCLASALDSQSGKVLWQKQLGLVGQGGPWVVGQKILCQDARGLFVLNQEAVADFGKDLRRIVEPKLVIPGRQAEQHLLVPRKDQVIHLTWDRNGKKVLLRTLSANATEVETSLELNLGGTLAGKPALVGDQVVTPLNNGALELHSFKGGRNLGPDWRAVGADEQAEGHMVALDEKSFLCTDGSRGLARLHLTAAKPGEKKEMAQRIVAAPVVVRVREETRLAVADASGTVTLLETDSLKVVRVWNLGDKITAGPFPLGPGLASMVGKDSLVWLDPSKDQPGWEYRLIAPLAGPPVWVKDVIVVADLAGRFLALDPATGRPLGPGYTLRADATLAGTMLIQEGERLLVPLTDGTMMVIPVAVLRKG